MFSEPLIAQLAAELEQAEQTRVPVEHFSRRFPGMTIEDGYQVARAWVQGEIVLGGSFTRPVNAVAGDTFHADYGPLGSIAFRFT